MDSTLTYENFGQAFIQNYCLRCHSSTRQGDARQGAPSGFNFDTLEQVRSHADHIDEHAAAGPSNVNTEMPPEAPKPTEQERISLGEWLSCGAP